MDKNFSIFKFLSQVFMIYGITTVLLNIFCILFGASARDFSTIFSLGRSGVGVATSFEFLGAIAAVIALRVVFMTDKLIKKMPLAARIVALFASAFAVILIFIFAFRWFPADLLLAWVMFIVCFAVSCAISTGVSVLAERHENKRLEEALRQYKERK
ncbi:MAG: hypothetical protein NC084_06010 [Bacteroides sp.]|nr:hypothetical protein [Eubacterium sp.]MCM1418122.1 hypothetical protein [Roseburia sp.]MCM1462254.1 hypothetical protein [Bacteroides sp.]